MADSKEVRENQSKGRGSGEQRPRLGSQGRFKSTGEAGSVVQFKQVPGRSAENRSVAGGKVRGAADAGVLAVMAWAQRRG